MPEFNPSRIGIVGYGEVGRIFGAGLRDQSPQPSVGAWDRKLTDPSQQAALRQHADACGVALQGSMAALCEAAAGGLIISAVTASNALDAAQEAAGHLAPGTVFLDLNSASPGTKKACAEHIEASGGRYVEAAVMTSVPPYGLRVPMLLGGPHAGLLQATLQQWGMDAQVASAEWGVASAIKMCRSVMIKGLEALVIESYATARAYGVEAHMLPTLQETFPGIDWSAQGSYFFSRVVQHGQRRAEEMREAARTVREAGFEPFMAEAIADKQQWMADQARAGCFAAMAGAGQPHPWQDYADRLLAARGTQADQGEPSHIGMPGSKT